MSHKDALNAACEAMRSVRDTGLSMMNCTTAVIDAYLSALASDEVPEPVAWALWSGSQQNIIPSSLTFDLEKVKEWVGPNGRIVPLITNDDHVARVARLRAINANLMGDDENVPRYTTKRLTGSTPRS
jgi:anti-sigma factor ChrR (cupin superfamily)